MLCARIAPDGEVIELRHAKSVNRINQKHPGNWADAGARGNERRRADIGDYHDPRDPAQFAAPWGQVAAKAGDYDRKDKCWHDPGDGQGGRIWTSWFPNNAAEPGTNTDWRDWSLRGQDPYDPDGWYEPGMFVEHDGTVWELADTVTKAGSGLDVGEPGTAGGADWVDRSTRPDRVTAPAGRRKRGR